MTYEQKQFRKLHRLLEGLENLCCKHESRVDVKIADIREILDYVNSADEEKS